MAPHKMSEVERIKQWLQRAMQMECAQFSSYIENRFSTAIVQAALALDAKYDAVTGMLTCLSTMLDSS